MKFLNPADGRKGFPTFQDPSGMQAIAPIGPIEEPFGPLPAPPGGFQVGPVPIQIPGFPVGPIRLQPPFATNPPAPIRAQPLPTPGHGLPPIVGQPTPGPILVIPGPQPTPGPAPITPGPQPTPAPLPAPLPGPQPFTSPTPILVPQPGPGPSGGGGFFNPQPFNVPVPVTPFPGPGPQGGGFQPGPQPVPQPQPQPLPSGQMLVINADPPAALEPSFGTADPRFAMEQLKGHTCPICGGETEEQQAESPTGLPVGAVIQDGRIVPPCSTCPG